MSKKLNTPAIDPQIVKVLEKTTHEKGALTMKDLNALVRQTRSQAGLAELPKAGLCLIYIKDDERVLQVSVPYNIQGARPCYAFIDVWSDDEYKKIQEGDVERQKILDHIRQRVEKLFENLHATISSIPVELNVEQLQEEDLLDRDTLLECDEERACVRFIEERHKGRNIPFGYARSTYFGLPFRADSPESEYGVFLDITLDASTDEDPKVIYDVRVPKNCDITKPADKDLLRVKIRELFKLLHIAIAPYLH